MPSAPSWKTARWYATSRKLRAWIPNGSGGGSGPDARRGAPPRRLDLGGGEPAPVEGKTAIIVDDGIATGLTMEVAIRDARQRRPARLVVGAPVAPPATVGRLG